MTFVAWPIAFPWYVVIRQRIHRGTFRQRRPSDAPGAAIAFFLACSLLLAGLAWVSAGGARGSHSDDGAGMGFFLALIGWVASGSRQIPLLLSLAVVAGAPSPAAAQACLVPQNQIVAGGPGKDGIPALTQPAAVPAAQGDAFLESSALVLGVVVNGEARAYPHNVLWWHEIINDVVGGVPIVASYCPLTGSGIVFDPTLDGQVHNFGVSGLLFDNNLIMFDRTTESLWSQMRNQSICGGLSGREPVLLPVVQLTWAAWKALNPDTTVVNFDTGFPRRYDVYPYGNYDQVSDTSLLFPQSVLDGRRQLKELVLGIVHEGLARAYPYLDLGNRIRSHAGGPDAELRAGRGDGVPVPCSRPRDGEPVDAARRGCGGPAGRPAPVAGGHPLRDVVRVGLFSSRDGNLPALAARGGSAPRREREIFRQIKAPGSRNTGSISGVRQRRAGGKEPLSSWYDFRHGLLASALQA